MRLEALRHLAKLRKTRMFGSKKNTTTAAPRTASRLWRQSTFCKKRSSIGASEGTAEGFIAA
jgi:hypothetical protein